MLQSLRRWWPKRSPPPGPEPPDPLPEILEGQTNLSRALGRLLLKVESLAGETKNDLSGLRGDLSARLRPPPLDDLFALADTLKDLLEELGGAKLLVFSPEQLSGMTVAQLFQCMGGPLPTPHRAGDPSLNGQTGPHERARDFGRSLSLCLVRLDRFFAAQGIARVGQVGEPIDGRVLRVVEVVERGDLPDSSVASVVRSGFVRGREVLREGDVVACRQSEATLTGGRDGTVSLGH